MNAAKIAEQVSAVLSRLESSGDTAAVELVNTLLSEISKRDEALLDLVADNEIVEDVDEGGAYHTINCGAGSFDAFLKAFGHESVVAHDPGAPDPEDAAVYLSALDFLFLKIENEGLSEEQAKVGGYQALQIPVPRNAKAVYWRKRFEPTPKVSP